MHNQIGELSEMRNTAEVERSDLVVAQIEHLNPLSRRVENARRNAAHTAVGNTKDTRLKTPTN